MKTGSSRKSYPVLKRNNKLVVEESKQLHEEFASLKTTVSAVVARGIGAKALIKSQEEREWKAGQEEWS